MYLHMSSSHCNGMSCLCKRTRLERCKEVLLIDKVGVIHNGTGLVFVAEAVNVPRNTDLFGLSDEGQGQLFWSPNAEVRYVSNSILEVLRSCCTGANCVHILAPQPRSSLAVWSIIDMSSRSPMTPITSSTDIGVSAQLKRRRLALWSNSKVFRLCQSCTIQEVIMRNPTS